MHISSSYKNENRLVQTLIQKKMDTKSSLVKTTS